MREYPMFRFLVGAFISLPAKFHATLKPEEKFSQIKKASEMQMHIKKLNVVGSLLYIAAHKYDENTRLIAYLANEALVQTAYLSLTRGD